MAEFSWKRHTKRGFLYGIPFSVLQRRTPKHLPERLTEITDGAESAVLADLQDAAVGISQHLGGDPQAVLVEECQGRGA